MEHFLSDRDVAARYHVSRQAIWRWARAGTIPAPVKLTSGCTRWRADELREWESTREVLTG